MVGAIVLGLAAAIYLPPENLKQPVIIGYAVLMLAFVILRTRWLLNRKKPHA